MHKLQKGVKKGALENRQIPKISWVIYMGKISPTKQGS